MNLKECCILNTSNNFKFRGVLNLDLVGNASYPFLEIPESIKHRPLKVINNTVVVDFQKEYDNKIEYQKRAFREFRDEILKQIQYAQLLGSSSTVSELTGALNTELSAYETRVLSITLETE